MSKPSRRKTREARKQKRKESREELQRRREEEGLNSSPQPTIANRRCSWETEEEERTARQEAVAGEVKVLRSQLPQLLKRFSRIPDPRNPKTCRHKLTVLLIYGVLSFVFQYASRREANREMTQPVFMANLRALFPELETLPHHDTLNRLLCRINVAEIESVCIDVVKRLIKNKKFQRFLVCHHYIVAIDGTQKLCRDYCFAEECLERHVGREEEGERRAQYYVYVQEAVLVFRNGMRFPLLSEFLTYPDGDVEKEKQDCELKAFKRLAARLKQAFPRQPIVLVLDGLYPNGPVFALCARYHWRYMIVLQDKSLRSVWEEAEGLHKLEGEANALDRKLGNRRQHFWWANDISYEYECDGKRKSITVHVVVCEESWDAVDPRTDGIVTKHARHAWVCSHPQDRNNVHTWCNDVARHRWDLENNLLVEKHQGYQYEHCFSYDWNSMRGYHYLMHLAHLFNELARYSVDLVEKVSLLGVRGLFRLIRETVAGPWLDAVCMQSLIDKPPQLRLA